MPIVAHMTKGEHVLLRIVAHMGKGPKILLRMVAHMEKQMVAQMAKGLQC